MSLLEERWRRGVARCDAWPEDRRIGVAEASHLQAALVAAMRGHSTSLRGTGPLSAVAVVARVEDLLDLLIGPDEGEPPFARRAAVHGPADLGFVRCQIRESRLAHVPMAWRFIAMAISASVLVETTLSTATTPLKSEAVINGPLPTLVGSLVDDEWQQWEERMSGWPIPVRAKLRPARRQMSAPPQSGYGMSAGILPNSGTAPHDSTDLMYGSGFILRM